MPKLFQNKYRIKSARLEGWDYSTDGYYFVTICTKNQIEYFGEVIDQEMRLNKLGKLAEKFWLEIPQHFDNARLDQFVIMPNHIHGIVIIDNCRNKKIPQRRDAINRVSTNDKNIKKKGGVTLEHNPMGKKSLGEIIRWYKGHYTFKIRSKLNSDFSWQTRFHDHIIRNEKELHEIQDYIINNPNNWEYKKEQKKMEFKLKYLNKLD